MRRKSVAKLVRSSIGPRPVRRPCGTILLEQLKPNTPAETPNPLWHLMPHMEAVEQADGQLIADHAALWLGQPYTRPTGPIGRGHVAGRDRL
jgi:hypothetical protein